MSPSAPSPSAPPGPSNELTEGIEILYKNRLHVEIHQ